MQYRRADTKGGTYFTLNLLDRKKAVLTDEMDKLGSSLNNVKKEHPFQLLALFLFVGLLLGFVPHPNLRWACRLG